MTADAVRWDPEVGRPDVIVDFDFRDGLLFIALANIGRRPALDISVAFEPAFRGLGGTQVIPELPIFHRLTFLAPTRRIDVFCDAAAAYFARGEPEEIEVRVAFKDADGRSHTASMRHDLSVYASLPYVMRGPR